MKSKIARLALSMLAVSLIACAPTRQAGFDRDMALIRASEKGQTREIRRLIEAGADVNAQNSEGWTPYLAASTMGHLDAMKILRNFGAKTIAPELDPERNMAHRYLTKTH